MRPPGHHLPRGSPKDSQFSLHTPENYPELEAGVGPAGHKISFFHEEYRLLGLKTLLGDPELRTE